MEKKIPFWIKWVPFLLSALFFMSAIFTLFAPIPLLLLRVRSGRFWMLLAALTNSALVYALAGKLSLAYYGVMVVVLTVVMSEGVSRLKSIEKVGLFTWLSVILMGLGAFGVYCQIHHL